MALSCSMRRRVSAWLREGSPPSSNAMYFNGWQCSPPRAFFDVTHVCTAAMPPIMEAPTSPDISPTLPITTVERDPAQWVPPALAAGVADDAAAVADPLDDVAPWPLKVARALGTPASGVDPALPTSTPDAIRSLAAATWPLLAAEPLLVAR